MDEPQKDLTDKDALQEFIKENITDPLDRKLLKSDELIPVSERIPQLYGPMDPAKMTAAGQVAASYRGRVALAIDLLAIRVAEKQAKSQDRHARAMRGLTWALVIFTAVQVLVEVGLWGYLTALVS